MGKPSTNSITPSGAQKRSWYSSSVPSCTSNAWKACRTKATSGSSGVGLAAMRTRLTRLPRVRAAVLTISTTIARGEGDDRSGPALVELCEEAGLETTHEIVSDDRGAITQAIARHADGGA